MAEIEKAFAVIPAWSGSQRVRFKNHRAFTTNESLTQIATLFCENCEHIEDFVVSTDIEAWRDNPKALISKLHTGDSAGSRAVWEEAIPETWKGPVLLLEPDSPFRQPSDVRQCLLSSKFHGHGCYTTHDPSPPKFTHPRLGFVPMAQELSGPNGAVWLAPSRDWLLAGGEKFMPVRVAHRPQVDTLLNFEFWGAILECAVHGVTGD